MPRLVPDAPQEIRATLSLMVTMTVASTVYVLVLEAVAPLI